MTSAAPKVVKAKPLSVGEYMSYGDVIAATDGLPFSPANFGTAKRFNFLAEIKNEHQQDARLNMCVFRCSAFTQPELTIKMLEKHPLSTQVFLPMQDGSYVTIVALGESAPDLGTLAAFVVDAPHGISYRPGVWHYPMTALHRQLDLACLIWEKGGKDDCVVKDLAESVLIRL